MFPVVLTVPENVCILEMLEFIEIKAAFRLAISKKKYICRLQLKQGINLHINY